MKQSFKKNTKSLFASLTIALALFSSCQNSSPLEESDGQKFELEAESEWTIPTIDESSISTDGLENTTRALNMSLINSTSGKNFPSIKLNYQKGSKIPVVAIMKNAKSGTTIIKQMQWTFNDNGQSISITGKTGGDFTDNTTINANNSKDWKLFLIMGGNYNDADKTLSFQGYSNGRVQPINTNNNLSLDAIYTTDGAWTPLEFSLDKGVAKFRAKSKIKLKNIGTTFLVTAFSTHGRHAIDNFYPAVSNYSFAGTFNLSSSIIDQPIPFEPKSGSSSANIRTNKKVTTLGHYQFLSGYFPIWGLPINNQESILGGYARVSDHSDAYANSKPYSRPYSLETNKIYRFEIPISKPEARRHPIEQFYADASGYIIPYFRDNAKVKESIVKANPNITIESTSLFNTYEYRVAEQDEYRIIAPGTSGGNATGDRSSGERPYIMMGDPGARSFREFTETVKAFGFGEQFRSQIKNTYDKVHSYGIRFKNGAGNAYYSAYRYEKLPNYDVKITVRVLGPQNLNIGIDQVSNEDWWRTNPTKLREIIRYVPRGVWMSSTNRAGWAKDVSATLSILPDKKWHKANFEEKGIYTSDHHHWGRYQNLPRNRGFGALIVAEQK